MEDTSMELATHPLSTHRDAWWWRLLATGASFVLFGLGGLVFRPVLSLLSVLPADPLHRRSRARGLISQAFHLHVQFMYRSRVLDFVVDGAERLGRPGQLVVANHPSLIDVVMVIAQIRDANCMVKSSLFDNAFTRGPVRAAGYLSNDGSPAMLEHAAAVLCEGQTLVIFPEGTRSRPGQPPQFHRGAHVIAPVFITIVPTTLTKAEPWCRIPDRRFLAHPPIGEDIDPARFGDCPLPIGSRRLNHYLHQLFLKELDLS